MAATTSSKLKCFTCFNLIFVAIFCCNVYSGNAQNFPAQSLAKAFFCFNNKYIYTGCDEAYRLTESGNLNVPREATDIFCNGPCLAETQLVLKCVDNILTDFIFNNKATIRDIRDVLGAGCSYTSRRGMAIYFSDSDFTYDQYKDFIGNFNVGDYFQGETSEAPRLHNFMISLSTLLTLIIGFYVLIL